MCCHAGIINVGRELDSTGTIRRVFFIAYHDVWFAIYTSDKYSIIPEGIAVTDGSEWKFEDVLSIIIE